jgi:glycine cleavage system aminomethyltransferase T
VRELRYFHFVRDRSMLVARLGYSGELGYELLVPAAEEAGLRAKLRDVPACGFEAADSLRIESGYVLFDREIDGRANPRELGLDRLVAPPVAFPLSRKLSGLEILDERAGREGAPAQLTSECFSPLLGKAIGLGFVAPQAQTGDTVSLTDGRGARVVPLPFYDPERRRPRAAPL